MESLFDISKELILISVVCSLLTMLFYRTALYQSIRFICALIIIAYMAQAFLPLYTAVGRLINAEYSYNAEEITDDKKTEDEYIERVSVGICKSVKSVICSRYEISEDDIKVSVTINNDDLQNIIIKNVTVTLEKTYSAISGEISKYVADMLGCGCTVIIK